MSFRENESQQISFFDRFSRLTQREQKLLENSWAKVFADEVFPLIDERPFSVLYGNKASRPNTAVNIIIGALIIKELFDYTDDEMVENLALDPRLQYALHTTSFDEQPLSDKSLSRFRKRCYNYETLHNVDLYHDCIKSLSAALAKLMGISGKIKRMDSMMIEANIRKLSRLELIYTCLSKYAVSINKSDGAALPDDLKHYTDPEDFNRIFYHQRNSDIDKLITQLLKDADKLDDISSAGHDNSTEYELFARCLSEQTIVENDSRRLRKKEEKEKSTVLQNPSDPEATFRTKAGKGYVGYAANLEESVGESGTIVTDYRYEPNNHSDSKFLKEHLAQTDEQEEASVIIADGAYGGEENTKLAEEKNIELITTHLSGSKAPSDIFADFEFSEDGKTVKSCAAGHVPKTCSYTKSTGLCLLSFPRELCANCPNQDKCKPKIFKKVAKVYISKKGKERAIQQRKINSEEFKDYARIRNGIETVPSNLRRNYRLDKLPRGKQRGKFFFGSKIAALNFKKFFNWLKGYGNYAQNPLLAG